MKLVNSFKKCNKENVLYEQCHQLENRDTSVTCDGQ
jgi:hypothetical protein